MEKRVEKSCLPIPVEVVTCHIPFIISYSTLQVTRINVQNVHFRTLKYKDLQDNCFDLVS